MPLSEHTCEVIHMKAHTTIILICGVLFAALFSGCTTQPHTVPATPFPTTLPVTAAGQPAIAGTWTLL